MSDVPSKSSKIRRISILKIRQTTATVEAETTKIRRRVSFHHEKAVKEYDKDKHDMSASSPLKEPVKEAMSDFDSTKSNSTLMSLATPDRTTSDANSMLFRGLVNKCSDAIDVRDMSISMMDDDQNATMDMFNGHPNKVTIHKETVDISYQMDLDQSSLEKNTTSDALGMGESSSNHKSFSNMTLNMDISQESDDESNDTMAIFGKPTSSSSTSPLDDTLNMFGYSKGGVIYDDNRTINHSVMMDMDSIIESPLEDTMKIFTNSNTKYQTGMRSNETMDMDISGQVDNTINDDDTMRIFGKEKDKTLSQDDTMNIFKTNGVGINESIMMDISKVSTPPSSQDETLAIFGKKEIDSSHTDMDMSEISDREDGTFIVDHTQHSDCINMNTSERTLIHSSPVALNNVDTTMDMFGGGTKDLSPRMINTSSTQLNRSNVDRIEGDIDGSFMNISSSPSPSNSFHPPSQPTQNTSNEMIENIDVHNDMKNVDEENGYDVNTKRSRLSTLYEVSSYQSSGGISTRIHSSNMERSNVLNVTEDNEEKMIDTIDKEGEEEVEKMIMNDDMNKEKDEKKINEMDIDRVENVSVNVDSIDNVLTVDDISSIENKKDETINDMRKKRSVLDETRLSDRTTRDLNYTMSGNDIESIKWMELEDDKNMVDSIHDLLKPYKNDIQMKWKEEIERNEKIVHNKMELIRNKYGDDMVESIMKLDPYKMKDDNMRCLFDYSKREARKELWEDREKYSNAIKEKVVEEKMKKINELNESKDNFILMNRKNELEEDVMRLSKEKEMLNGMNEDNVKMIIDDNEKKKKELDMMKSELTRIRMERSSKLTDGLKNLMEKSMAVDEDIAKKLEEKEKIRRNIRKYMSQL